MTAPWAPYLPREVLSDLARSPDRPVAGRRQRLTVVAMFVDIADFTPMSEALARCGTAGTEQLTEVLNGYFTPTMDLIESFGGSAATFAGDAMTVLFPCTAETVEPTARRALQCALELEAGMSRYEGIDTAAGPFSLRTRIGVAVGTVLWTVVGNHRRLHCVMAGDVLGCCAAAEHAAGHGQVVAHDDVLRHAGRARSTPVGGPFHHVTGLALREPAMATANPPDIPAPMTEDLRRFLHPAVARRIAAGQERFVDEHRRVTTVFVSFPGLEQATDLIGALQALVAHVDDTCDRLGGNLVGVQLGDKGSTAIVAFGAPVAHDDDESRALACALELRDAGSPPPRIGVTTGVVYCGRVGSERRRDYTIMGDPVNVAARLMQAAEPGQILVDAPTRDSVGRRFSWRGRRPLAVKGKSEPVDMAVLERLVEVRPADRRPEPGADRPPVGRSSELALAGRAIDDARAGAGRVLAVVGNAGVGKSKLGAEIARMARGRGLSTHPGAFEAYRSRTSYLGWRDVWWSLLGVDRPHGRDEAVVAELRRALAAIDADLVPRLPLLGPLLGLDIPDTDLTTGLEPALRAELLRSLLLACLRARSAARPLVIVLEDCRWMDPPSAELLDFLGRNVASLPVLLLVLHRPGPDRPPVLSALRGWSHAEELRLAELDYDDMATLVRARCRERAGAEPSDSFVGAVCERAGGNPLFAETLVDLVLARGGDLSTAEAAEAPDLPDSLSSAVLSRIDELDDDEQITLKLASVVGRRFRPSWLAGSYPPAGTPEEVERRLRALARLDMLALEGADPEPTFVFRNVTVQAVAYRSLAHANRESLHESTGTHIERANAGDLSPYVELLAHHFGNTRNAVKQRTYFELAGDKAKAAYANAAAIDYYRRLQPLVSAGERAAVLLKLGEVSELVGQWPRAESLYREALAAAQAGTRARALSALGSLLAHTDSYDEALRWLGQARTTAEALGDVAALGLALERLSWTHWRRADYAEALDCAHEHLRLVTAAEDPAGIGAALENIGVIEGKVRRPADAVRHLQQALDHGRATGDQRLVVHALNDLAVVHAEAGDFGKAVRALADAGEVAGRIGYRRAVGYLVGNEAELRLRQGDDEGAVVCGRRALRAATELGDAVTAALQLHTIAVAQAARGRAADAGALLRRAIELERTHNEVAYLCDSLHAYAEVCATDGRLHEAEAANREALQLAGAARNDAVRFRCELLAARLAALTGDAGAARSVDGLRALLLVWTGDAEQAAITYELWRLDPTDADARNRAAELYAALHRTAPNAELRRRCEELTGERLEAVSVLPPLPPDEVDAPFDLDKLLRDLDTLVAASSRPPDEGR